MGYVSLRVQIQPGQRTRSNSVETKLMNSSRKSSNQSNTGNHRSILGSVAGQPASKGAARNGKAQSHRIEKPMRFNQQDVMRYFL